MFNFNKLKQEISSHKFVYLLFLILFLLGIFIRIYRVDVLLRFYFDQGRDALVISKMLHGSLVLIGPVTGLDGVFLGPFYYYFLAVGYLIGQGSPVVASYYQSVVSVLGIGLVFFLVRFVFNLRAAFYAFVILIFSANEVLTNRWLANPTPTIFFSPLTLLFFSLGFKKPIPNLLLAFFSLGLMLQLEASDTSFLVLISFAVLFIYRKNFGFNAIALSIGSFLLTLLPQIFFDLRHNFLLLHNILGFLNHNTHHDSQAIIQFPTMYQLDSKINFFASEFLGKLKVDYNGFNFLFFLAILICVLVSYKYFSKPLVKISTFWFFGSLIFFIFYQGNYGRVYGYYLNPITPIFIIFSALALDYVSKLRFGFFLVMFLITLFLFDQYRFLSGYLQSGLEGDTISFGNESQAVRYVLADANSSFNVDVYVPPVIPYVYDYLFQYYGKMNNKFQNTGLVKDLYTLHEKDLEIPKREANWLKRQDGIGKIVKSTRFGGIGVEKRERI